MSSFEEDSYDKNVARNVNEYYERNPDKDPQKQKERDLEKRVAELEAENDRLMQEIVLQKLKEALPHCQFGPELCRECWKQKQNK